jgi:hypothetical protein
VSTLGALTAMNEKQGSSYRHISAAAAFRRPPPATASSARSRPRGREAQFLLVFTRAAGVARRPLGGIATEHDSESPPMLSVAIPPARSVLHGMSIASRH